MSSNNTFENKVTVQLFAYKSSLSISLSLSLSIYIYIYIYIGFGIKLPTRIDTP